MRVADASQKSWRLCDQLHIDGEARLVIQLRNSARAAFPEAEVSEATHFDLMRDFVARMDTLPNLAPNILPPRGRFVPLSAMPSLERGGELSSTSSGSTRSSEAEWEDTSENNSVVVTTLSQ